MNNKSKLPIFILVLVLGVIVSLLLIKLNKSPNKISQNSEVGVVKSSAKAKLILESASSSGNIKELTLKATFTDSTATEKLDYFKTVISLSKNKLVIPKSKYVDVSMSGLNKIIRVDGPMVANQNGQLMIELGTTTPGSGPGLDKSITLAKFMVENNITEPVEIKMENSQMINNNSINIPVESNGLIITSDKPGNATSSGINN